MTNLAVIGAGNMGIYSGSALRYLHDLGNVTYCDPKLGEPRPDGLPEELHLPVRLASAMEDHPYRTFLEYEPEVVKDADFVLFCVPTEVVNSLMRRVLPDCKKGAIISGQTSRKTPEAEAFDEYMSRHPDSGLSLVTVHTMCNPSKSDPYKEILGIVRHNPHDITDYDLAYERAMRFYGGLSEHVEQFESVDEHDTRTANTQINTSRTFLSLASALAKYGVNSVTDCNGLTTMQLSLAMRAASLPDHVYRGIQLGSRHGRRVICRNIQAETALYAVMHTDTTRDLYEDWILEAKRLFGEHGLSPILSGGIVNRFQRGEIRPDSLFPIIQYAFSMLHSGINPWIDLKATTPMFTSLLCLTDFVFTIPNLLEEAIEAGLSGKSTFDSLFHDEWNEWSDAIQFNEPSRYDRQHRKMRRNLEGVAPDEMGRIIDQSVEIVRVCRESMASAIKSGAIQKRLEHYQKGLQDL